MWILTEILSQTADYLTVFPLLAFLNLRLLALPKSSNQ